MLDLRALLATLPLFLRFARPFKLGSSCAHRSLLLFYSLGMSISLPGSQPGDSDSCLGAGPVLFSWTWRSRGSRRHGRRSDRTDGFRFVRQCPGHLSFT
jgi:hypothetical protein